MAQNVTELSMFARNIMFDSTHENYPRLHEECIAFGENSLTCFSQKKLLFFHNIQNTGYEVQRHHATFILSHTAEKESKAGRTSSTVNT